MSILVPERESGQHVCLRVPLQFKSDPPISRFCPKFPSNILCSCLCSCCLLLKRLRVGRLQWSPPGHAREGTRLGGSPRGGRGWEGLQRQQLETPHEAGGRSGTQVRRWGYLSRIAPSKASTHSWDISGGRCPAWETQLTEHGVALGMVIQKESWRAY